MLNTALTVDDPLFKLFPGSQLGLLAAVLVLVAILIYFPSLVLVLPQLIF